MLTCLKQQRSDGVLNSSKEQQAVTYSDFIRGIALRESLEATTEYNTYQHFLQDLP